tara:strand:+ start:355 stop:567 length:213 start_codon:yes stop_codon:yes gene_type:complete
MALQHEELESTKKQLLGEARVHNTKIEDEIQRLEEEAMEIEREIAYQRARLRAMEARIVDSREFLITLTI